MGEVYRAKDTKLGREVAIKVLPGSVSSSPERLARFEREARTLAAVNHPNIVTIYSVEESNGVQLLAMELVEGRTLDLAIPAGGLALPKFFEIAVPMADALSAAHERGIVHRDLKPGNVMITTEGRVKVLDFGLAKIGEPDSDPNATDMPTASRPALTREGAVFGTVAYMSPEQARGDKIDARSDVFSLGIVLYEMLAGVRPFRGASTVDMISAILRDQPSPVTEIRPDLPAHMSRVLRRCLEKNPRDRYQTSRDVFNELRDLAAETSAVSPKPVTVRPARVHARPDSGNVPTEEGFRIAVLPFKSSGDAETGSFAGALGEEIATGLSRFRYLSVVASAPAALDAGLGARYALEGSIRKGGPAIRVSARLVDVETGARLWAETYNRDVQGSDIFAVQDDVAARIVATVADSYGVLVHSIRSAMRKKDDADLTPIEWQFQYFAYREQITPASHEALEARLKRVAEQNDRQSDVWACLAQIYLDQYAFGFRADATSLDRALAAARRAVELDRANQFALVALAQVHFFRRDLAAFGPAAERAMALNSLNTDATGILGLQIVHTGEFERGTSIVRRAMELNPNHAGWMHFAPLWEHFYKGEYEQALERANRVDVPGLFWPYLVMASACGHLGRQTEAEAAVKDLLTLDPEFAAHARSNIGTWHFASGLMDSILDGLRKAGLSIPENGSSEASGRIGTITGKADGASSRTDSGTVQPEEGFRVAVLPFRHSGASDELAALTEGLTEGIVTGLSRFSYLRVIARSSAFQVANESVDVRAAGKELGARYVMDGSLRQAGTKLRLAVQLVDTTSGAHLWAETFERTFTPNAVFELQDDLVPRIVSTVADMNGVLPHSMSEAVRSLAPDRLSPYEAVLRSFGYFERVTPEDLAAARSGLELAVQKAPAHSDAWAMLAHLCIQEYGQGFTLQADALTRGATAARRAVETGPSNPLAYFSLAEALFFEKEFQRFENAAERAVALNPMDGNSTALLGELLTYAGNGKRGLELTARAKQLNPNHPGWYWYADCYDAYRRGDDSGALGFLLKVNLPNHWGLHAGMAAVYGQLGKREEAVREVRELLRLRPDFADTARKNFQRWWEPDYVERFIEGLRKAGLEIPDAPTIPGSSAATTTSGTTRADEGFWVAVLPFKYSGPNADLTALADGLSEEIVTGLSRFSYLRVIARGSTAKYSSESVDLRSAGKEVGARYVMEGSLRQAGTKLRLSVQLVDADSGVHLWAENYERSFSPENIFAIQDDLVPRIVSTVADQNGILTRRMSETLRSKHEAALTPHEAVLRAFSYFERVTPEEHAVVRRILERAVREAPDHADSWAMLSLMYSIEFADDFNLGPDPLDRALAAAQRSVHLAATHALGHYALAFVYCLLKEPASFRATVERAIALNPMDGSVMGMLGVLMCHAGELERGCQMAEAAMQLNPNYPGLFRWAAFTKAYGQGKYAEALELAVRINMPNYFYAYAARAAALGQLGRRDAAEKELRELLALRPDFATAARREYTKWYDSDLVERMLDGLRKAGLEIEGPEADAATPPAKASVSIAVLPFSDMSPAKDQEYLCEGMAEEIMNALVRVPGIRVASRTSAFRARQEGKDLPEIARLLSVSHVLEGRWDPLESTCRHASLSIL